MKHLPAAHWQIKAVVNNMKEILDMKDPLEKSMDAKDMEAEMEQAQKGVLMYRDCLIARVYPPGPGVWYEWARDEYVDLDSPWYGTSHSIQDCKDEIDEVYAEEEE